VSVNKAVKGFSAAVAALSSLGSYETFSTVLLLKRPAKMAGVALDRFLESTEEKFIFN